MNQKRIVIDGKVYNSVDEMPPDVRRNYEEAMRDFKDINPEHIGSMVTDLQNFAVDKNNNGIPDILEGNQAINLAGGVKFVVDGITYDSVDQLPSDARARYERATESLDKNRNGTPDFLEGMMNISTQQSSQPAMTASSYAADTTRHASRAPMRFSPAIAPDTSNGWMLALAILFLLMLCAAGAIGIWYFFLR